MVRACWQQGTGPVQESQANKLFCVFLIAREGREKKGALLLNKVIGVRMGCNLGFIEKIVLVDGTVLENMHVLYRASIPNPKQLDTIFHAAAEVSFRVVGPANENWSVRPETMKGSIQFFNQG